MERRHPRVSSPALVLALLLGGCAGAKASLSEPASEAMLAPVAANATPAVVGGKAKKGEASYAFSDDIVAGGVVSMNGSDLTSRARLAPVQARAPGAQPPKPRTVGDAPKPPPEATAPAPHLESMLIYTASLTLAVFQVDASLGRIEELSRTLGGYLASRNDAAITVRIPRAKFQEALAEVAKIGDVLHREVAVQDVSDEVVDIEARLKNARAMRERLAQLLQGANATKDALEIEKELSRVMGDIEAMEGKLQLLSDKIAFSTLTVSFQPVHSNDVHAMARLPFPWLQELGLGSLLQVK
jgi:hypothetical protein